MNEILTSDMIANEMLDVLQNNLVFAKNSNRQFKKEFETEHKIGDTVTVRKPARYVTRSGPTISVQDHVEEPVPVKLEHQKGVDVEFSSKELRLDLKDFSKQVIQPQIATLANTIDLDGMVKAYQSTANAVGTYGTPPTDLETFLDAGVKLDDNACPMDEQRGIIVNPRTQAKVVNGLKGLFQSSTQIKNQYERGVMGTAAGFDWAMSQNVPVHTVGPLGGTPLVNGAGQTGASLVTDGWTAAAALRLKKGDVFTIAGVFSVNPQSRLTTGALQQFVVTADVESDASGNATIPIWPSLIATGARQTVTALPGDNAAITVLGTGGAVGAVNLAHHKDAFTLVSAELPLPNGMDMASRASSKKVGLSIRFIRGYDITNDKFISRMDVLYGWGVLRQEHACRIHG